MQYMSSARYANKSNRHANHPIPNFLNLSNPDIHQYMTTSFPTTPILLSERSRHLGHLALRRDTAWWADTEAVGQRIYRVADDEQDDEEDEDD